MRKPIFYVVNTRHNSVGGHIDDAAELETWARELGGRQEACLAATGSWTACSRRITHAELRRPKTVPGLGPAAWRSALRANRRLVSAETIARIFGTLSDTRIA